MLELPTWKERQDIHSEVWYSIAVLFNMVAASHQQLWRTWNVSSMTEELGFYFIHLCICFLGPHLRHMDIPRPGVESELQLPAYTTATATRDLSHICDLYYSSWQCRILNPPREARDRTWNLMVPSQICFHCAMTGTPRFSFIKGNWVFCFLVTNTWLVKFIF